ncbi:MAG: sigma-70 family RNA polymerase sigma factor [Phycisphaerae bacterium]|nr:sigma-70 family RNA polymerase sigma factor [Phycisphaerae bacterium]NUQ47537.1 sigma-70 family RNA polymerase sigma factor [Phycisphaerae bacterium]
MNEEFQERTTTVLLERLFDPDDQAVWQEFDARFRPVIEGLARRVGLSPVDAADVTQETLVFFVRDYRAGKYDRGRGRLRAWVLGIARHQISELMRRRASRRESRGQSAIIDLSDEDQLNRYWEQECRQAMLCRAMRSMAEEGRIHPRTLEAFRRTVIEQRPPDEVAAEMGLTVRSVYLAKHRCLARLREHLERLKEDYDVA